MLEVSPSSPAAVASDLAGDPESLIAALRQNGGERFDPVRFRFIEGVARRLPTQPAAVRKTLGDSLLKALSEYGERFGQAQDAARDITVRMSEQFPEAAEELARLCAAGDFGGLRRCAARLEKQGKCAPLAELVRLLAQHSPDAGSPVHNVLPGAAPSAAPEAPAELRSLTYFRDTWSKLSVDQQLTQALAQAPENAGPLNSHLLVLLSLQRLRELAPDYLNRLMSHVDALLWLDQASGGTSIRKTVTAGESDKKRKPARAKSK